MLLWTYILAMYVVTINMSIIDVQAMLVLGSATLPQWLFYSQDDIFRVSRKK